MWILPNVLSKFPSDNTMTTTWSPVFYTSFDGYSFRLKLKFNLTHLGIYFVLIPGYNDLSLQWPFHQRLTIALMQNGQWDTTIVKKTIDPEKNLSEKETFITLGRPLEDYGNITRGWKEYYPKQKMEDKIYIMISSKVYN